MSSRRFCHRTSPKPFKLKPRCGAHWPLAARTMSESMTPSHRWAQLDLRWPMQNSHSASEQMQKMCDTVDGQNPAPLRKHGKPLLVGYRGINILGFLRWCRISSIHSSSRRVIGLAYAWPPVETIAQKSSSGRAHVARCSFVARTHQAQAAPVEKNEKKEPEKAGTSSPQLAFCLEGSTITTLGT